MKQLTFPWHVKGGFYSSAVACRVNDTTPQKPP
jgi:hypothetical protein